MKIRDRYLASIAILIAIAVCFTISSETMAAESKEVKELTLTEIQAGSPYRWMTGASSGAGRWVVKNGKFGTDEYGEGYFKATEMPAIVMGTPPGNPDEAMQWSRGTTHVLIGKNALKGFVFDGDPKYPLTFKLIEDKGYVYLCGRGTVTAKNGQIYRLGYADTVDMWIPLLRSDDPTRAEAAAQALGYLATTQDLKNKVIPELINATSSSEFGVYWNATEALGRLADSRALSALEKLKAKGGYIGRLAEESIKKIKGEPR